MKPAFSRLALVQIEFVLCLFSKFGQTEVGLARSLTRTPSNRLQVASSTPKHYATAPEDKVAVSQKVYYALAGVALIPGMQLIDRLAQVVLNMGLGIAPTLVGVAMFIFRIWDAFAGPYFGNLSDNYRSKWGRRKPFIVVGGILCAITLPLMWIMPRSWSQEAMMAFFIVAGLAYNTALTIYTIPYFSLAAEMTPDTHERTSVIGVRAIVFNIVTFFMGWLFWFLELDIFGGDKVFAMRCLAVMTSVAFITFGIIPMMKVKEPYYQSAATQDSTPLWDSFKVTVKNPLFVILVSMMLLMTLGMQTVGTLGYYVSKYYVFHGDDKETALVAGYGGTLFIGLGTASIPLFIWLSKKYGKITALYINSFGFLVATLSQWFLITPEHPYWQIISAAAVGPVVTGIWIILPSMQTDVIDADELETGRRREGSFSAIMGWVQQLGFALSVLLAGVILDVSGFDVALGAGQSEGTLTWMRGLFVFFPIAMACGMIALIRFYPLTEERCHEIRLELEQRRGKLTGTAES